mmetsp:Transcript_9600/g.29218  ORF Transcript_9600/g.29218 Transcript_9600/m.29218 type:complete len:218 (-) Transcript_9600:347-1000(-)
MLTYPNWAVEYTMRSSAHLDRWVMIMEEQNMASITQSLSDTASMLLGHTPSKKPRSSAMTCLSTPKGLPARAPDPSGSLATLGVMSLSLSSSRCRAAQWERSQWLHLTVWAGCKWVKPGMRASTSCSDLSHAMRRKVLRSWRSTCSRLIVHSLPSVATWSFLDLPVCSFFPASPMSSTSLLSFAVWMSSSFGATWKVPSSHSLPTSSRPSLMESSSC